MTLSRGHSFKIQSTNQFKLKSNFKSKNNAIIQCQQNIELPIENTEKATTKNSIYKNRIVKKEQHLYGPEINSDAFHAKGTTMSTDEHRIQQQSTELLSMAPNIESDSKKIRLTITPMHVQLRRNKKNVCYNKLRRSTTQPQILRSWFSWFRPKKNAAFYSPPLEHPTKGIKINIHTNDNPNGIQTAVNVDSMSSNEDEEISNSSLKNVDRAALKDELDIYMDEIRAREKR